MSDDFVRLVSTANPAYHSASNGYPPSSSNSPYSNNHQNQSPQLLDPFFDDDDDLTPHGTRDAPDSAFGSFAPMQSKESNIHLASAGAPPAGTSKLSLPNTGAPQGWTFDDDEPEAAQSAQPPRKRGLIDRIKRTKLRWPWQKEVVLTGERVVALNLPEANAEFISNYVSTSKYNFASFVPKFLFGACSLVLS